jgi:hypothetical protein
MYYNLSKYVSLNTIWRRLLLQGQMMTKDEEIALLKDQLKEAIEAFEEYIHAVDSARRSYHDSTLWQYDGHDDRIDAAEQRLWKIKEEVK